MPQVASTGPNDPNNTSPGNAYNSKGGGTNNAAPPQTTTKPVPKDQIFECIGRGLKPNTIHKFYYENIDRTGDCIQYSGNGSANAIYAQITGKMGGPLTTDSSGFVRFFFFFTAAVEQQVDALNRVNYNLIGDKIFELRAVDSTAKKVVPFTLGGSTSSISTVTNPKVYAASNTGLNNH